jgi:drug/metabolite transporter (DMT)-like permease
MKLSLAERILGVTLVAYIVCDVLLTPPAHLETRNPALVTGLGIASLALLFIGLALSIVALVLMFRGSRRAPIVTIIAAVLYFPAFLAEQTGHFSSLRAPAAIEFVEVLQAVVALVALGIALWVYRRGTTQATGR